MSEEPEGAYVIPQEVLNTREASLFDRFSDTFTALAVTSPVRAVGGALKTGAYASREIHEVLQGVERMLGMEPGTIADEYDTALDDYTLWKKGAAVQTYGASLLDPRLKDTWLQKGALALGSTVPYLAAAAGGAAIAGPPGAIALSGAYGMGEQAAEGYERAAAAGMDEETRMTSARMFAPLGAIDAIPMLRVLGRWNRATGGMLGKSVSKIALKEGFKGGVEEMAQEIGQQVGGNIIARKILDFEKEEGVLSGTGEAGALGFGVGAFLNTLASAAGVKIHARFRRDADLHREAKRVVRNMPDLAATIAGKEQPSRSDVEGVDADLSSAASRRRFHDAVVEVQDDLASPTAIMPPEGQTQSEQDPLIPDPESTAFVRRVQNTIGPDRDPSVNTGLEAEADEAIDAMHEEHIDSMDEGALASEASKLGLKKAPGLIGKIKAFYRRARKSGPVAEFIDRWMAKRDRATWLAMVRERRHQEDLAKIVPDPKRRKLFDFAATLLIDMKEYGEDLPARVRAALKVANQQLEAGENVKFWTAFKQAMNMAMEPSRELQAYAEQIATENRVQGQWAQKAGIIGEWIDNYIPHFWSPPEGGWDSTKASRFALKTSRGKARTLPSILDGLALGKTLQVTSAARAQRIATTQVWQTFENRAFIGAGFKTGLFSTSQRGDMIELNSRAAAKWESRGNVKPVFYKSESRQVPNEGDFVVPKDETLIGRVVRAEGDDFVVQYKGGRVVSYPKNALVGRVVRMPQGVNFFVGDDGTVWEKRPIYAVPELAKSLNRIMGRSHLKGNKFFDAITKWNAALKHTILTTSLFHHQAIIRSYMVATGIGNWNIREAYRRGGEILAGRAHQQEMIELVEGSLTLGERLYQDFAERDAEHRWWLGKKLDKMGAAADLRDMLVRFRDRQSDFLFGELTPRLKAMAALINYQSALEKHDADIKAGRITREEIARKVATLMNEDFGGLHLGAVGSWFNPDARGRNPTAQHIFRLLALAPDWTESNIRTMIKRVRGMPLGDLERELYRAFWVHAALKLGGMTVLANLFFAFGDDRSFWKRYQDAWNEGHLRWLDVDVTPLYLALGKAGVIGSGFDARKKKYFSLVGHFRDPIKFVMRPGASRDDDSGLDPLYGAIKTAKSKASPLARIIGNIATGTDWANRPFTTFAELIGMDEKGLKLGMLPGGGIGYVPRKGKKRFRLVDYPRFGATGVPALTLEKMPSWLIYEARSNIPIPAQAMIAMLAGEIDAFDAFMRASGIITHTTYPTMRKQSYSEFLLKRGKQVTSRS